MGKSGYILALLAVTGGLTIFLRALPFLLFGSGKSAPHPAIQYIGRVLSPAAIAMLVVYCMAAYYADMQDWNWNRECLISSAAPFIAGITVVLLQYWKKNSLVSIIAGTAVYMVMLQLF